MYLYLKQLFPTNDDIKHVIENIDRYVAVPFCILCTSSSSPINAVRAKM